MSCITRLNALRAGGAAHRIHSDRALAGVRHLPGPQDLPRRARHSVVQRRQAGVHPARTRVTAAANFRNLQLFDIEICSQLRPMLELGTDISRDHP